MSHPRRIYPGQTILLTRRTLRRHHLFRPDAKMNQLFLYCVATMANKWGIQIHALIVMGTHFHIILTDIYGQLPNFTRDFHRLLALGTKVLRGWEGSVFDRRATSMVELRTPRAIIEKSAYLIVNAVEAGLVKRPEQWPGVCMGADEVGEKCWHIERPDFFFNEDNRSWPKRITLCSTAPPALLEHMSLQQIQEQIGHEVSRQQKQARAEVRRRGWRFCGPKKVLKGSPYARAKSPEPGRQLNPCFAVGQGNREALLEAVAQLQAFRAAYRKAIESWKRGFHEVLFPEGTWWMRVFCRVETEPIG